MPEPEPQPQPQDPTTEPTERAAPAVVSLLVLALLALAGVLSVSPPSARDATAPATDFSAERAFQHVQRIGQEPHVTGSPAAARVRDYLVQQLEAEGVVTEVQEKTGRELSGSGIGGGGDAVGMARVHNVIGTIRGSASTGRLILMAHYDSAQVSFGGNDDGAGVSTMLETARALKQGPQPRNDIVFLFTDAEEACLCGAEAYMNEYGGQGGVVLNFEARGTTGPPIMFETSRGNADLVDIYSDAVPHPVATSFAVEIYRILPNDTDFSVFLARDNFTGLNAAYIDGSAAYHSPQDTPANLDRGSLQAHGDNALALARAFGAADLASLSTDGDETYFPMLTGLVSYPGGWTWSIAILALLAVVALAVTQRRQLLAGFALAVVPLLLAPVLAQAFWAGAVALRPGWANLIDPWRPLWLRLAVVSLTVLLFIIWYLLSRRRISATALAVGGLGWLALVGVALAAFTPGGSYLGSVPALAGAVAMLVARAVPNSWGRAAVVTLGAAVAVLILAPTVYLFFPALGLELGAAPALLAAMLGLALLAVVGPVRRLGVAAIVAAALFAGFTVTGFVADPFDAGHPLPTQLMYALDTDDGSAWWATTEDSPSEWTSRYVTGKDDIAARFPMLDPGLRTGKAEVASLSAPTVEVVSDTTGGTDRRLTLRVRPQRAVRLVYFGTAPGSGVTGVTVDGREAEVRDGKFGVLFHAPPQEGVEVSVTLPAGKTLRLRTMDGSDGLDGLPSFAPRPSGVGVLGSHESELVVVAKTHQL